MSLRRRIVWFTICAAVATAMLSGPSVRAAEPFRESTDLFTAGELGYTMFRIPGIVVTARGQMLAYCEARREKGSDWTTIELQARRSRDGGKTWSPPQPIVHRGPRVAKNPVALKSRLARADEATLNNPVAIADRDGSVHLLYCAEYARCFAIRSDDDGATWSDPVEITATFDQFRSEYDWKVIATGPGHGIQLRSGRLLVPVWLSLSLRGNAHHPSVISTISSDDHGRTWNRGAIAVESTPETVDPNETVAVELADGRVMLNVRTESATTRRLITVSPDGVSGWSKPEFHDALLEPVCEASMARLSTSPPSDRNRLLFCNPDTLDPRPGKAKSSRSRARKNLSIKLSYDEGRTWPVSKTIEPGISGYSDLAVGPDGTIFCLYESASIDGGSFPNGRLVLARLNLPWLSDGRDALPETPAKAP